MGATLSATGQRLLGYLPPLLRSAYEIDAIMDACGREVDRIDEAVAEVRDNLLVSQGQRYLRLWEKLLGLTVDPPDKSTSQRRASILAYLRALPSQGAGTEWEEDLDRLIGSGWLYEEFTGDGSPPDYTLLVTIPYADAILAPSGLAATPASGGSLPNATYYYVVTATNSFGETPISNRVSAASSGSNHTIGLTWGAVTGATGYNVFRSTTSGQEKFLVSVVSNSHSDAGAVAPDPTRTWPTLNTTKSPQAYEAETLARHVTPAHLDLVFRYAQGFIVGVSRVGEEAL